MGTDFPSNTRALLARSAFSKELLDFARWLGDAGYTPSVTHQHLLRLEQVLPRLSRITGRAEDVHRCFAAVGRGVPTRRYRFEATERAYCRFLDAAGRLVGVASVGRYAELCGAYEDRLRELRGLSLSAREHHAATIADFLARALPDGRELDALTLDDVERYVALRGREVSRNSLQHVVAHVRSFLRFCHEQEAIGSPLDGIDTPRTYRGELPPQALPWSAVQTLIRSVDIHSKAGRRDRSILHLMAHYGLRPSEVVSLRVDSINWDSALLHVRQSKTRSELVLPLAPQTIRLLRSYVQHERTAQDTPHPQLFLRARCPSGPLERYGVNDLFKKRVREAKLDLPGHNVYRLRHTFAMRLLTRGVGVKAIGDLLGHRSLESTCAYLRLHVDMLRGVALEVPKVADRHGGRHV
jgi:site-specific recombinase XerD